MKFIAIREEYCDEFGNHEECKKELVTSLVPSYLTFDCRNSHCWVIHKGLFGKYKIRECIIRKVIFDDAWAYQMNNGWIKYPDELNKTLFEYDKLDAAIRICEEKNRLGKVKVKRL